MKSLLASLKADEKVVVFLRERMSGGQWGAGKNRLIQMILGFNPS